MFTIKHLIRGGMEQLFQAKSVVFVPRRRDEKDRDESVPLPCGGDAHLYCTGVDGAELYFQTGAVYVMNENGKTVGKYELDFQNGHGLAEFDPATVGKKWGPARWQKYVASRRALVLPLYADLPKLRYELERRLFAFETRLPVALEKRAADIADYRREQGIRDAHPVAAIEDVHLDHDDALGAMAHVS